MRKIITQTFSFIAFGIMGLQAQNVGVNTPTPDASAALDVVANNRGVLIPRLALTATNNNAPVAAPATSLLVYNTATAGDVTPGFYYWDGSRWVRFETGGAHNTLDMAYDEGGAGAGRVIATTSGDVEMNGTNGLSLTTTTAGALNESIYARNTRGSDYAETRMARVGTSGGNTYVQGLTGAARGTAATNLWDGMYGISGSAGHPTNGTVNLNATIGSVNKYIGAYGGLSTPTSITGSAQDMIAAVAGVTGSHNSGGGSVTGAKMYAGLFAGNGRTLGLWGENSTFMEFLPRWQNRDYDAAVVGFYNSAANGGNNGASTGTADSYFSIETNVTDATSKDLILQARSTGDVGINTNAPTEQLDVNGDTRIRGLAGTGTRMVVTDANGVLGTQTIAGPDNDWTVTGTTMYNNNTGNVGIGTTAPGQKLSVAGGNVDINNGTYFLSDAGGATYGMGWATEGGSQLTIFSDDNIDFTESDNNTVVMHIDGNGNRIGMGTTTPSTKLDVVGVLELSNVNPADPGSDIVRLGDGGTNLEIQTNYGYTRIGPANTGWSHFATDRPRYYFDKGITVDQGLVGSYNENLQLQTSGTTRMTILTANGYVGVNNGAPATTFHINQLSTSSATAGLRLQHNNNGTHWTMYTANTNNLWFMYNGGLQSWIQPNGTYSTSDRRLKSNIQSFSGGILDRAMSLNPVTYYYNNDEKQTPTIGFIAQEVKELFPQAVQLEKESGFYGVKYDDFGVISIAAMQEMKKDYDTKLKTMEDAIELLKQEIDALKKDK
ncbi:MAG: tail fiber domain-containing protein [Aureispira sp.]|nr:tail fiber domain-containing protein [Aureispira sp.]